MSKKKKASTAAAAEGGTGDTTVKVLCASLGEAGVTYAKGKQFRTTAERAAALGDAVEIVGKAKQADEQEEQPAE